jgi:hypothetical protein
MNMRLNALAISVALASTSAMAGNWPEFDAVGSDNQNYFNDAVKEAVVANVKDGFGTPINTLSNFIGYPYTPEYFRTTAAGGQPSPCFPDYIDHMAGVTNANTFDWGIVLQMKPESDLDLNIRDCVVKNQGVIWGGAQQTGRFRTSAGVLQFRKASNPSISVRVCPGDANYYLGNQWCFTMDARMMPTLNLKALDGQLYTSKALWEEGIVMAMPEDGAVNKSGEPTYRLREGDQINVHVDIPRSTPAEIHYGPDNVSVKYIGETGYYYLGNP